MKRFLLILYFSFLILGCNVTTNAQDVFFGIATDRLGVVVGNTVKHYYFSNNSWSESDFRDFIVE